MRVNPQLLFFLVNVMVAVPVPLAVWSDSDLKGIIRNVAAFGAVVGTHRVAVQIVGEAVVAPGALLVGWAFRGDDAVHEAGSVLREFIGIVRAHGSPSHVVEEEGGLRALDGSEMD